MADARPRSEAADLSSGVPKLNSQKWHPLCPGGSLEGCHILRSHSRGCRGMCVGFRPIRPWWTARSHHCPNCSKAGLLLSLDLRSAGLSAASDGDTLHPDCADYRHRNSVGVATLRIGRREELASSACRHSCFEHRGCHLGNAHSARLIHSVESTHGSMERRSGSSKISTDGYSTCPTRGCGLSVKAVQELSLDRRSWRGSRACSGYNRFADDRRS